MESTTEIKNKLISRIQKSNDLDLLRTLQSIFDSSDQELYPLSDIQKKSIEESRKQIQNGEVLSHESVVSEAREWLSKK